MNLNSVITRTNAFLFYNKLFFIFLVKILMMKSFKNRKIMRENKAV